MEKHASHLYDDDDDYADNHDAKRNDNVDDEANDIVRQ